MDNQNSLMMGIAEQAISSVFPILKIAHRRINSYDAWIKPDGSYVTPFDFACQFVIKKYLLNHTKNIPFIGEENILSIKEEKKIDRIIDVINTSYPGTSKQEIFDILTEDTYKTNTSRFWLLDPIDGTKGFIDGQYFATALALLDELEPVISVMACPTLDKNNSMNLYSACKHHGAYCLNSFDNKKQRLNVSSLDHKKHLTYCEPKLSSKNHRHADVFKLVKQLATSSTAIRAESQYKYALIAEGSALLFARLPFVQNSSFMWDHAPGVLVLKEAGGFVKDTEGKELLYNNCPFLQEHIGIIATSNEQLLNSMIEIINK